MPLQPGDTLGPYEITAPIGSGGMGEVYRARDTRLDRDVAIKVLPAHIASSPDALARFEREAKVVAGLSHPNITALHDFGRQDDRAYAVMELLEGQTVRDRLEEGALPLRKAREAAVQIARGLGAAHEKGVVHRDLKPENLFLTRDGHAKILDFGLASRAEMPAGEDTPTRTNLTQPGSVMGTVGYMSPEQVKGEVAEVSSDLFSFGAVLFEMFTGTRAFQRGTAAETMTAVLREEPGEGSDAVLPPAVSSIVRRCLEKNPHERFHSAHDLAFALEALGDVTTTASGMQPILESPEPERRSRMAPTLGLGLAALVLLAVGFGAGRLLAPGGGAAGAPALELTRLTFMGGSEGMPRLEPGGNAFLFVAGGDTGDGNLNIFLQRLGGEAAINLTADSDGNDFHPAYSPDGQQIAFRSDRDEGGIFLMGATGESVRRLTDFGFDPAWSPDGRSLLVADEGVFDPGSRSQTSKLWRIEVATGEREELPGPYDAVQPRYSPSGERIAYWGLPAGTGRRTLYTVASVGGDPVSLNDDPYLNWNPVWGPDGRHLYFTSDRGGRMNLWRLPIDEATGQPLGEPQPVTQSTEEMAWFDIGPDGRIVVAAGSESYQLRRMPWDPDALSAGGEWETLLETSRVLSSVEPSPDGKWVALYARDRFEDLFVVDAEGGGMRRLTNDSHRDRGPVWGPDSETLYFYSDRSGRYEIWSIRRDGSGLQPVTESEGENLHTPSVSPDGTRMAVGGEQAAFVDLTAPWPISELEALPNTPDGEPGVALSWSPDGTRMIAFSADYRTPWLLDVASGSYEALGLKPGSFPVHWLSDREILIRSFTDESLSVLDLDTGKQRPAGDLADLDDADIEGVSPTHLYSIDDETQADIWLLAPPAATPGS